MESPKVVLPQAYYTKYGKEVVQGLLSVRLPLIKPEQSTERILLIRHALSEMNFQSYLLEREGMGHTDRMKTLLLRKDLVDPNLHEIGQTHSEQAAPLYYHINFSVVVVSPLRRALQTAIAMFKHHPKVADIQFIIEPQFREVLNISNDIPNLSYSELEEIKHKLLTEHKMNLDISSIANAKQPWAWALPTLQGPKLASIATRFHEIVEEQKLQKQEITHRFVSYMLETIEKYGYGLQNNKMLYERAERCKTILSKIDSAKIKDGEVLGVVCHSKLIEYITAKDYDLQEDVAVGGTFPKNCQGLWLELEE